MDMDWGILWDKGLAIVERLCRKLVANLFRLISSPYVPVRDECQQHVCPPPFGRVL